MYRKSNSNQMVFDFHLPFGGKLRSDNRWVILSQRFPGIRLNQSTRFSSKAVTSAAQPNPVEFGAKVSISLVDGFSFIDVLSWDPYNESGDLQGQIESYRARYGFYPESVHADKIYRTRDNRRYCKKHGIRLSGPPLGRPRQAVESNKEEVRALKRQQRRDEIDRIAVEGKFGQGKRRFTLNRIMAKLAETSEAVIMVSFIVMNLEKILSGILQLLFDLGTEVYRLFRKAIQSACKIISNHLGIVPRYSLSEGYRLK